jgi:hypothetical protein
VVTAKNTVLGGMMNTLNIAERKILNARKAYTNWPIR